MSLGSRPFAAGSRWRQTRLLLWWAVVLLGPAMPRPASAIGWVTPTGNTDGTGWSNGALARDGSTVTYASHAPVSGWGGWETFSLGASIWSDRFRVHSDFGYGEVDSVQVDVSPDAASWTTVHAGPVADATWDSRTFAAQNVQYARFRYHRITTSYVFWLYEFNFYEAPGSVGAPTVTTTAATSVDETSAILHGLLVTSGGEPCEIRFQYGLTTAYEIGSTAWVPGFVDGGTSGAMITGATSGLTYHFRAQARNSNSPADGADATFTCGPPATGWVSPTGHSDATGRWLDGERIYDDEAGTFGKCYHNINDPNGQWSPYLYLLHASMVADSIRFLAKDDSYIDQAQVDVSNDGVTWLNVFDAAYTDQTWAIGTFAGQYVNRARVRFHLNSNNVGMYWELNEFDFQTGRLLSVALSNSQFAFGCRPANTWLAADSTVITNDCLEYERVVAQLSAFTSGANTWTLSPSANGANQVRIQWSTTAATGPWTNVAAYNSDFTIAPNLAPGGTVKLYLRIQTPTSSTSYNAYSSTLTATAQ